MPLTKFRCPDNTEIKLGDCILKCRMGQRCLSKPTLMSIIAGQREWSGKPSTTQLLNGTMMEYLKVMEEYAIDPRSRTFALMGISHHEAVTKVPGNWKTEIQVGAHAAVSGILDLLEPDEWHCENCGYEESEG